MNHCCVCNKEIINEFPNYCFLCAEKELGFDPRPAKGLPKEIPEGLTISDSLPFKRDCRYFKGYKPCSPAKVTGVECWSPCPFYSSYKKKILIIKQGEIGDVIRTTPLLKGLKEQYPTSYIVWLVQDNAKLFIKENDKVDEVLVYSLPIISGIQAQAQAMLLLFSYKNHHQMPLSQYLRHLSKDRALLTAQG